MSSAMWQIALVIWRECSEGLLAVGVLHAWLSHQSVSPRTALRRTLLWIGAVAGGLAAVAAGLAFAAFEEWLEGDAQAYLQLITVSVAALLILHLTLSARSGPSRETREELLLLSPIGVALAAGLAVFREGFEAVIFVSGLAAGDAAPVYAGIAVGAALSMLCFVTLQFTARFFSWRKFFGLTRFLLLLLAASMTMTAVDRLIDLELLSPLSRPLWDSSWLIDERGVVGNLLTLFAGYRARPELLPLLIYMAFWLLVLVSDWRNAAVRTQRP